MRTLYVSDLDGTLLRSDERTGEYTNHAINRLTEQGMIFAYATARSFSTARKVTAGLDAQIPLIVYNGAFIVDNATGRILQSVNFAGEGEAIVLDLISQGVWPIVYALIDGVEKFSYIPEKSSRAVLDFVATRKGNPRDRPVHSLRELLMGDCFYIACIQEPEKLLPFYEKYRDRYHCVYQRDIYSGEQWLELMPQAASKAGAILRLKELLGCDRVVAFGDGVNDVDMFQLADEAYAVANAVPELKAHATAVIGRNDEDAVAHWLEEHASF